MSHSCDETYDVYDERQRRAIKAHECEACGLPIRKGDQYTSVRVVFNDGAETIKRCARCQTIHEHLREMAPGEMWPDEKLNCGTLYRDEWEREPPAWLEALAFWQPGDLLPALYPCTVLSQGGFESIGAVACRGGYRYGFQSARLVADAGLPRRDNRTHAEACS